MDELKWYGNGADRSLMLQTHPPILVNYATTTSAPPIPFAADRDAPFITKVPLEIESRNIWSKEVSQQLVSIRLVLHHHNLLDSPILTIASLVQDVAALQLEQSGP